MNSHQRRRDRREYRYDIRIERTVRYDEYREMFEWCCKNFGTKQRCGWRERYGYSRDYWQFSRADHATAFAMRWL